MRTRTALSLVGLLAPLTAGCRAAHYDYDYEPYPMEVHVQEAEDAPPVARALLTPLGIADQEVNGEEQPAFFVRARIENRAESPIALDLEELELVDGSLQSFAAPLWNAPAESPIEVGAARSFEIAFPFDPAWNEDELDLETLNLRWGLIVEDRRILMGSTFEREGRGYRRGGGGLYYGPAWGYPWGWYGGFGFPFYGYYGYYDHDEDDDDGGGVSPGGTVQRSGRPVTIPSGSRSYGGGRSYGGSFGGSRGGGSRGGSRR